MIPTRCSVRSKNRDCVNPPLYAISIIDKEEYMIGVVCGEHRAGIEQFIEQKQGNGLPLGSIRFTELKYVGTDCLSRHRDELK